MGLAFISKAENSIWATSLILPRFMDCAGVGARSPCITWSREAIDHQKATGCYCFMNNHEPSLAIINQHEPSLTGIDHHSSWLTIMIQQHGYPSLALTIERLRLFFEVVDALRFLLQDLFDLRHHPNVGWATTASTWVSHVNVGILRCHGGGSSSCAHTGWRSINAQLENMSETATHASTFTSIQDGQPWIPVVAG